MRLNDQILNTALETLETSKSRCHSLGYQMAGFENCQLYSFEQYAVSGQEYVQIFRDIKFIPYEGHFLLMEVHPRVTFHMWIL